MRVWGKQAAESVLAKEADLGGGVNSSLLPTFFHSDLYYSMLTAEIDSSCYLSILSFTHWAIDAHKDPSIFWKALLFETAVGYIAF